MKRVLAIAVAFAALTAALPASAATGIDCVSSVYTESDQAVFDQFGTQFRFQGANNDALTKSLVSVIATRAQACATQNQWTTAAKRSATLRELAVRMERALRANGWFDAAQLAKLDKLMTGQSGETIRSAIGPAVRATVMRQPAPAQDAGQMTAMGIAIIASGLPADAKSGDYIGQIIGARLLNEISGELFAAQ